MPSGGFSLMKRDAAIRTANGRCWKDLIAATLTIDALVDSIVTLFNQNPLKSATMTALGFNPMRDYQEFVDRGGYYSLFSAKRSAYRKQYAAYAKPDFAHPSPTIAWRDRCLFELATLAMEHAFS